MRYTRDDFIFLHGSMKDRLADAGLVPHGGGKQFLTSQPRRDRSYMTLRYWRDCDALYIGQNWFSHSCVEVMDDGEAMYIGVWFGSANKEYMRLRKHLAEIEAMAGRFTGYGWCGADGKGADPDLLHWLCEDHETNFRRRLRPEEIPLNGAAIADELIRLRDYLDVLLAR